MNSSKSHLVHVVKTPAGLPVSAPVSGLYPQVASTWVYTQSCPNAESATSSASPTSPHTVQTSPTFAFSVQVASVKDSSNVCFPVAGITTSSSSPQISQVFKPFPSSAQVAAVTTTVLPNLHSAGICLYPNSSSHNAQAYFPTPATVHVASFNVATTSGLWVSPSALTTLTFWVLPHLEHFWVVYPSVEQVTATVSTFSQSCPNASCFKSSSS